MSLANCRLPFKLQLKLNSRMQGCRSLYMWFSAQKKLVCRRRMQLWTSSWSTSVQEGCQDIYLKLYLFIYVCRSNLLFYILVFLFYLLFSLLSKEKERLHVSRFFTLHSNWTARSPQHAERPSGRSFLWCASLGNKQMVAQRKKPDRFTLETQVKRPANDYTALHTGQGPAIMCMLVHCHSYRDSKGNVLQLLWSGCVFGLVWFGFSCCAAGRHWPKKREDTQF